jgi:phthiocerol/phenolphthiocerol synthesis type-I polyketide synthase E
LPTSRTPSRAVVVADTPEAAAEALERLDPKRVWSGGPVGDVPAVAFLFPGQGAQYVGMAHGLYEALPVFRATVDRCAEQLRPLLGLDLRTVLFPEPSQAEAARRQLTQTALAQPALFTVELALARQWASFGAPPAWPASSPRTMPWRWSPSAAG